MPYEAYEELTSYQNWTILGLHASVLLLMGGGLLRTLVKVGDRMSSAIDKNTQAVADKTERITMLINQHDRSASEIQRLAGEVRGLAERINR